MAKSSDEKHDDESINEASNLNNKQHVLVIPPPEQQDPDCGNYIICQTPTSDDHKVQPLRYHLPPPPPRKRLPKRRRRLSDDGTTIKFFEETRRGEVDAFFGLFNVRVCSSCSRKRRSHSI